LFDHSVGFSSVTLLSAFSIVYAKELINQICIIIQRKKLSRINFVEGFVLKDKHSILLYKYKD